RVELSRTLSPTLSVNNLAIADPDTGYRAHTSSLELQINLPWLLLGRLDILRLWLGDTRVELTAADSARRKAAAPAADWRAALPTLPVVRDLRIGSLRVASEERELELPTLSIRELALAFEAPADTLVLTAEIEIGGQPLAIEATVPELHEGFNARRLRFSGAARGALVSLDTEGYLDLSEPQFVVDGRLSAQASDLSQLPTGIKGLNAPGKIVARAQVAGTAEQLALSDMAFQWQGPGASTLKISGRIDDLDDLARVALDVSGRLGESPWLKAVLPDSVAVIRQAELSGQISGSAPRLAVRELNLTARNADQLDVSLRGQLELAVLDARLEAQNLDLRLNFEAPTTRAARALLFDAVPELGAVRGQAEIRSKTGDPSFENIVVSTRDPAGIQVGLQGRVAEFPLDPYRSNRGYDLDVSMKAAKLALMGERLALDLPIQGPAAAEFRIEGDTQALRLEQIDLAAGKKDELQLSAAGQLHFRGWDRPDPLQMINLELDMNSADTRALDKLLGIELPELGALSARARLQTVSNRHQIKDFEMQTARGARVSVALSGAADHVELFPEPLVEDIAVSATASTSDISRLDDLFGWGDAIPAIGPARATARIAGSNRQLSVSDIAVTAGKGDILLLKASGRLGTLSPGKDWHPRGTDLKIEASASGSKALANTFGYRVPELGPIAGSAQLRNEGTSLMLESGLIRIGDPQQPVVRAEGSASDLLGAVRTRWDVALQLDGHRFAQFADQKPIPDLGDLRGQMRISNSGGSLGIDSLDISSSGSELVSLSLTGQYADFGEPESLSLTGVVEARDLEIVGALLDRDWPAIGPFKMETRLSRAVTNLKFDAWITAGKARVHADLLASLQAKPPLITGRVLARDAFVPSLVKWRTERIAKQRAAAGPVFGRDDLAFDWMHSFDLDLTLDVESFDPELSPAQTAQARIAMRSGRLQVRPASIRYPVGELKLDMQVDARETPRLSFKAHGKDLRPRHMMYMEEIAKKDAAPDPDLDIDIDLSTSGSSPHELAAGARGEILLELKNGFVRRDMIDLVFADLIGWVWSKSKHEGYYRIQCAVADYHVEHGLVSTRAFLIDGDNLAVSGEGTIDLGKEQVDYVFLPKKKSRLIRKADPVKVTGALNDPSVKVIPWKSAATTYGPLLFGPFIFAGATAAGYLGEKILGREKESPCLQYEKARGERGAQSPPQ
ncbi:MAG: AsmA-like C-terminal region-containing protein, partial [Gammaproteobacteria bacterium]